MTNTPCIPVHLMHKPCDMQVVFIACQTAQPNLLFHKYRRVCLAIELVYLIVYLVKICFVI